MAWVYILATKNGKFYVGSTQDVRTRFEQHTNDHTFTTKRLGVEKILLQQEYKTLKEARSVERKIKKLKRRDYVEKMLKDGYIRLEP